MTANSGRIHELDYLKGIFILLMVIFHLAAVEQTYPVLREAVYTFHMPAFLIISGYLANVEKPSREFGLRLLRILVPYVIFESLYIVIQHHMGAILGAHNAIAVLTFADFIVRIATLPTGPYWYLHTLAICFVIYYIVFHAFKLKGISGFALSGLVLFGLTLVINGLQWDYVIYFMIGMAIKRSGNTMQQVITPSLIAILPLIIFFSSADNFHAGSLAGVAITVLVMSALLAIYPYCGSLIRNALCYFGRNSLAIVIFSPIFTLVTKNFAPYFDFDPSVVLFAVVALAIVVGSSLMCAWLTDQLNLSRFVFVKDKFYLPFVKI